MKVAYAPESYFLSFTPSIIACVASKVGFATVILDFHGSGRVAACPKPTLGHLFNHLRAHCGGARMTIPRLPGCGEADYPISAMLERVPATYKVIRYVRVKMACAKCDVIVEAPAPSRPIERGLAGPNLLAHVLVSKYADHLPLYRQSEIFAREGIDLDRSTPADWVGAASHLLTPLVDQIRKHVLAANKIHADDTPVPVLAPGDGQDQDGKTVDVCAR
jgi:transposase